MRSLAFFLFAFSFQLVPAQVPNEVHERIRAAFGERNYLVAANDLRDLETQDPAGFRANNYDYLSARNAEKTGDTAAAMAGYQSVVSRNSILKSYALWHLSRLAKAAGNLTLERVHLQELISFSRDSLLAYPATVRMAQSWFESGNYALAIR